MNNLHLQVGFEVLGQFMMGEVQINVKDFVELKAREGGGHEIFDYARTIMAYDPSTFVYRGEVNERVFDMIGGGSIVDLDLSGRCKSIELVQRLTKNLTSDTCRVTELKYVRCCCLAHNVLFNVNSIRTLNLGFQIMTWVMMEQQF